MKLNITQHRESREVIETYGIVVDLDVLAYIKEGSCQ